MSEPDIDLSRTPRLVKQSGWSRRRQQLAVVLWCGFLGAVLMLLAMLMAWEPLSRAAEEGPSLAILALCFGIGWLIAAIVALMAMSLSAPPRDAVRVEAE